MIGFRLFFSTRLLLPAVLLLSTATVHSNTPSGEVGSRALTIDDVLANQRLDQAVLSPDGEWAALVVQRPAGNGEVYGRNAYEIDASRSDIILLSMRTGERRAITNGFPQAAGYWCAMWSPDGQRLAMLSTRPEGNEPRGGDNVRLYVWEWRTGALTRVMDDAVPTQMRYGGPYERLDFRGGGDRGTTAHACSDGEENAPFLWLDATRILAATLPQGEVSAILDRYTRPFRVNAADQRALHDGTVPTGRVVGSGAARVASDAATNRAILRVVDTGSHVARTIASVPTYPFAGGLSVSVSPDGQRAAVLATLGAIQPRAGRVLPNSEDDMWTVERRLGTVDLAGEGVRWIDLPASAPHPLALHEWSPDSRYLVVRARADHFAEASSLFAVSPASGESTPLGEPVIEEHQWGPDGLLERPVLWSDSRHVVVRLPGAGDRADWWLIGLDGRRTNLSKAMQSIPAALYRAGSGQLVGFTSDEMVRLDTRRRTLATLAPIPGVTALMPNDRGLPTDRFLLGRTVENGRYLSTISANGVRGPEVLVPDSAPIDFNATHGLVLTRQDTSQGIKVEAVSLSQGRTVADFALNGYMQQINWGEKRLLEYTSLDGKPLNAAVILPPDYQPGRQYPTLLWVYQGYQSRSLETDYFLDPAMPGIYNMYLYAARGYVVLLPSIPWPSLEEQGSEYAKMAGYVLPAADRLIALGIADPERLGVFGQSRGGYTVMALLTQTDRFKAGVAMAGISDLSSYFGEFDPMARGYPGIEHEKSNNWAQVVQFGRRDYPVENLEALWRGSPLYFAANVHTPLLLIHGELDLRDPATQSEQFFAALYAQGKTAQLVRYGGEGHSLAQSPANIRDIYARTITWFDRFLNVSRN